MLAAAFLFVVDDGVARAQMNQLDRIIEVTGKPSTAVLAEIDAPCVCVLLWRSCVCSAGARLMKPFNNVSERFRVDDAITSLDV